MIEMVDGKVSNSDPQQPVVKPALPRIFSIFCLGPMKMGILQRTKLLGWL